MVTEERQKKERSEEKRAKKIQGKKKTRGKTTKSKNVLHKDWGLFWSLLARPFCSLFLFNFLPKLGRQHIGDYGKKTLESYQFSCLQSTQLNTPKNHFLSPFLSSIFHPLKSTRPKWRKHSTYRVKLRLSPSINDLNKSTYCQRVPFFFGCCSCSP